ncbi:MAG: type 1 glutamine amidotransferase domain-containing protein [Candidatus Melainabacteria bacterium]|nr:type 1 glutamine amidotransferase domain-containing protein [Candidatus Melainabacteria bacterium]
MSTNQPLLNKKIAVLLENEFIPEEIETYKTRFAQYGAEVHLMSRLWGNASLTFYSDPDGKPELPQAETVSIDFQNVRLDDYAAVIMAANYTSCRLRYFEPPKDAQGKSLPVNPTQTRTSPAVQFFAHAMQKPNIVKGALCHGLWILTPVPELLANRRVICHEVVLADIYNAGAIYTPSDSGIVIDRDLVTGYSKAEAAKLVDAIRDQIMLLEREALTAPNRASSPSTSSSLVLPLPEHIERQRRILVLLSEKGYWGEELVGPLETFDAAGYEVEFATPTGKRPIAITVSMQADFIDPPLARAVTTEQMAEKVAILDDPTTEQGQRLNHPRDLSQWLPERPYWSAPQFVRRLEAYYQQLEDFYSRELSRYDALLIVGGSGPIVDLANNQRAHDLLLGFYKAGKPIAAECNGIACLAFARDIADRKSILWGKRVTGHCLEFDYHDGIGFMKARGEFDDFNMGAIPYPIEYILRDATGPEGAFIGNFGKHTSVVVDYPFITGRSTSDGYLTGQKLVEVLETSLRRWGWEDNRPESDWTQANQTALPHAAGTLLAGKSR